MQLVRGLAFSTSSNEILVIRSIERPPVELVVWRAAERPCKYSRHSVDEVKVTARGCTSIQNEGCKSETRCAAKVRGCPRWAHKWTLLPVDVSIMASVYSKDCEDQQPLKASKAPMSFA